MIEPLLSKPLYRGKIKELSDEELFILDKDMKRQIQNGHPDQRSIINKRSENDRVLNHKELNRFHYECLSHVRKFFYDILAVDERHTEIFITQSWLNLNESGQTHPPHWHPNSVLSGVIYLCTNDNDAICFEGKPVFPGLAFSENENSNSTSKLSDFMCQRVKVEKNDIILFPSNCFHSVELVDDRKLPRVSLAFNTSVSGALLGDMTQLASAV